MRNARCSLPGCFTCIIRLVPLLLAASTWALKPCSPHFVSRRSARSTGSLTRAGHDAACRGRFRPSEARYMNITSTAASAKNSAFKMENVSCLPLGRPIRLCVRLPLVRPEEPTDQMRKPAAPDDVKRLPVFSPGLHGPAQSVTECRRYGKIDGLLAVSGGDNRRVRRITG